MKKFIYYTVLISGIFGSLVMLNSCGEETPFDPDEYKENATGDLGKVIVVMDKNYWNGPVETKLLQIFEREMYLPQPEPFMDVELVSPQGFTNITNKHHSILKIEIANGPSTEKAYISEANHDFYAFGQLSYNLYAPTVADAVELLEKSRAGLLNQYINHSCDKIKKKFKSARSEKINEELALTLGVNADVPITYIVAANHSDFVWMQELRTKYADGQDHEIQVGLMFYEYPYTDSLAFSAEKILAKRDSMTKKYINGFVDGSFMVTERTYGIEKTEKEVNGQYVYEMRGIWKMDGAFMGGPFVSYTMFDEERERILVLEGYVYAPHFRKMEYIREVEAIIGSFSFAE